MAHVVVLVLGDVGRSPRMCYHALSLSQCEGVSRVSLVGYKGEREMRAIREANTHTDRESLSVHYLPVYELSALRCVSLLHAVCKGLSLCLSLLYTLLSLSHYDVILIQNPPCLPALLVALLLSLFNGSKVVLDWHNLGFSMFAERLGEAHPLVSLSRTLEHSLARHAHAHIAVSQALTHWLKLHFAIESTVFYDRPIGLFSTSVVTAREKHDLLHKLDFCPKALFPHLDLPRCPDLGAGDEPVQQTVHTLLYRRTGPHNAPTQHTEEVVSQALSPRTALIVSATSWSADEDFSLCLDALVQVEHVLCARLAQRENKAEIDALSPSSSSLSCNTEDGVSAPDSSDSHSGSHSDSPSRYDRVLCVITGKGPLREAFEARYLSLCAEGRLGRCVAVRCAWLASEDYPRLLRCADLALSLHTSTSGLDLPMKILDFFGSSLPVCAVHFASIHELVQHRVNGHIFADKEELASQILHLFFDRSLTSSSDVSGENSGEKLLRRLRERAGEIECWETHWTRVMQPLVRRLLAENE